MDADRFDDLTRRLGTSTTRRAALRGAAGGLLGVLGLNKTAGAQVSQAQCGNKRCQKDPEQCADGCVCCLYHNSLGRVTNSRCRPPGTCGPGTEVSPTPTCPTGERFCPGEGRCAACCADADCDDGDLCAGQATCNAGVCVSGNPVTCSQPPATSCDQSVCDSTTGGCITVPKNNGASCDTGASCRVNQTCTDGTCGGGDAVSCSSPPICQESPGQCFEVSGPGGVGGCYYTAEQNGIPCGENKRCSSGTCNDCIPAGQQIFGQGCVKVVSPGFRG